MRPSPRPNWRPQRRHGRRTCHTAFTFVVCVLVLLLVPLTAHAANYQTCIRLSIRTTDSGRTPANISPGESEDYFANCDAGCSVVARGIRVKIAKGSFSTTQWADPVTGCINWSSTETSGFSVTVYSRALAASGLFVRVHDGRYNIVDGGGQPNPGSQFGYPVFGYAPTANMSDTITVGASLDNWTLVGLLAYAAYRMPLSGAAVNGSVVHAGLDTGVAPTNPLPPSTATATSNYQSDASAGCWAAAPLQPCSASFADVGHHMIVLGADAGGTNGTARTKFLVGHEFGHAVLRMWAQRKYPMALNRNVAIAPCAAVDECSGIIPTPPQAASSCNCQSPVANNTSTQICFGTPFDVNCSVAPNCYATGWGAYAQRENHSYTIEEGFADWVSASIWNDRTQDQGTFTLFGRAHDLRYYKEGAGTNSGGHTRNECGAVSGTNPSFVGHSTREDFQRMLWRWRANQILPCSESISVQDVFNVYRGIRDRPTVAVGDNWPWINDAVLQYKPACRLELQIIASAHGVKN